MSETLKTDPLLHIKGKELIGSLDSNNSNVQEAKELCSNLANIMNRPAPFLRLDEIPEIEKLLYQQAMMDILKAQMMVVKFLTFNI